MDKGQALAMWQVPSMGEALAKVQVPDRGQALARGQVPYRGQVPLSVLALSQVQALSQFSRRQSKIQSLQAAKKSPPEQ